MLENGVSDFEPKSLTTHSVPNAQQSRNAAKSLSRATTGAQVSNLGMENVPSSSTNKKLGKSKAHLGEKSSRGPQAIISACAVFSACYSVLI